MMHRRQEGLLHLILVPGGMEPDKPSKAAVQGEKKELKCLLTCLRRI